MGEEDLGPIWFLPPPFLSRLWNQPFCHEHRHDIKQHLRRSWASWNGRLTAKTTKNDITATNDHLETKIWRDRCSWEKNAWHKQIHKSHKMYISNFSMQCKPVPPWHDKYTWWLSLLFGCFWLRSVYQRYSRMKKAKVLWQRDQKNYVSESPELVPEMFKRVWWRNVAFHLNH